jgi:hypothetical protein
MTRERAISHPFPFSISSVSPRGEHVSAPTSAWIVVRDTLSRPQSRLQSQSSPRHMIAPPLPDVRTCRCPIHKTGDALDRMDRPASEACQSHIRPGRIPPVTAVLLNSPNSARIPGVHMPMALLDLTISLGMPLRLPEGVRPCLRSPNRFHSSMSVGKPRACAEYFQMRQHRLGRDSESYRSGANCHWNTIHFGPYRRTWWSESAETRIQEQAFPRSIGFFPFGIGVSPLKKPSDHPGGPRDTAPFLRYT